MLISKASCAQAAFAKREGMETAGCHRVVGLPGFGPGSREPNCRYSPQGRIDYLEFRAGFVAWLTSRKLNRWYQKGMVSYLDRFVREPIQSPNDVIRIFNVGLTQGQQNNLIMAMYNLLKYCRLQGFDREWLILLRESLPKPQVGMDIKVPTSKQVIESLRVMAKAHMLKHRVAYNVAVDSGLRITEIMRVLRDFDESKAEHAKGFWVLPVQFFRKSKLSYYAFVSDYTFDLLGKLPREDAQSFTDKSGSHYTQKRSVVGYKYLRKFVFDTMTDERRNMPESVADFIEGRTPKSVGARHYMMLKRKGMQFYPRYAKYVAELRQKALN
jgi:intergrase/recombinase